MIKLENISDILEEFNNEFKGYLIMTNGSVELYKPRKRMHEVIRSKIEQLLGRIELKLSTSKDLSDGAKLVQAGYNLKSSEIANQILNLKK